MDVLVPFGPLPPIGWTMVRSGGGRLGLGFDVDLPADPESVCQRSKGIAPELLLECHDRRTAGAQLVEQRTQLRIFEADDRRGNAMLRSGGCVGPIAGPDASILTNQRGVDHIIPLSTLGARVDLTSGSDRQLSAERRLVGVHRFAGVPREEEVCVDPHGRSSSLPRALEALAAQRSYGLREAGGDVAPIDAAVDSTRARRERRVRSGLRLIVVEDSADQDLSLIH